MWQLYKSTRRCKEKCIKALNVDLKINNIENITIEDILQNAFKIRPVVESLIKPLTHDKI